MPTRILFLTLAGFVLIGSIFTFSNLNAEIYDKVSILHLPTKDISLIVVNNSESRIHGLSGMPSLPKNKAMLFVFDEPAEYGIWMKDMNFPIDIFWLDEQKKIVHIKHDASQYSYPEIFRPTVGSLYVLETVAGFAKENNLAIGETLNFELK